MRTTPTAAALTGAYSAVVGLILGPLTDASGPLSAFWLLLAVALVAIPSRVYVLGTTPAMAGRWHLRPDLLKRVGAWVIGCISVASLASLVRATLGPTV